MSAFHVVASAHFVTLESCNVSPKQFLWTRCRYVQCGTSETCRDGCHRVSAHHICPAQSFPKVLHGIRFSQLLWNLGCLWSVAGLICNSFFYLGPVYICSWWSNTSRKAGRISHQNENITTVTHVMSKNASSNTSWHKETSREVHFEGCAKKAIVHATSLPYPAHNLTATTFAGRSRQRQFYCMNCD